MEVSLPSSRDGKPTVVRLVESDSNAGGLKLVNSYLTTKNADPMDLVELARQVQKADEFTRANAGNKLLVIADQIRYLQEQARKVLEDARRDALLHHAACNMVKKPGTIYHLYERPSGQIYFSILSPQEWGDKCPHLFVGSFHLEYDMSWTELKDIERRHKDLALVDKILNAQLSLNDDTGINLSGLIKPQLEGPASSDHAAANKAS